MGGYHEVVTRQPSASASAPAPLYLAGGGGGGDCGFDWSLMQLGEWFSSDPLLGIACDGTRDPAVFTPPPRDGYFHAVLALSMLMLPNASNGFWSVFLCPPTLNSPSKIKFSFRNSGLRGYDKIPVGVVHVAGFGTTEGSSLAVSGHKSMFGSPQRIIVPPQWSLLLCRDNTGAAESAGSLIGIQMAYADLCLGTPIQGF